MKRLDVTICRPAQRETFDAAFLPDSEKERLCRSLLAEFGATKVKTSGDGELIHSCLLPFGAHANGDKSPSASLNYKKLTYNCLGCGSSGGLLWFIGTCRGTRSSEARKWLNTQTGEGPDDQSLSSLLEFFDGVYGKKDGQKYKLIPKHSSKVLKQWQFIHPYMTEIRGIPEETLIHFNVGYAENYQMRDRDGEFFTSPRIVIPHFWKDQLVGWQTRRLLDDGSQKYTNSPDFPKDQSLYNYDERRPTAVIVESPMSVLSKFHCIPNMESTFGASVTDRQVNLIGNHRKSILWFDNDEAGWNATGKIGSILENFQEVWVVDSDLAADAADVDDDTALELIANPIPFALWTPPKKLVKWG